MNSHRFLATTARGLEPVLLKELSALQFRGCRQTSGGVFFEGDAEMAWQACLKLRTATRILQPLARFECETYDKLYEGSRTVEWEQLLVDRRTFAVEVTASHSPLTHSHHAALRIKDAVVDRLRDITGSRPDVNTQAPDIPIHAFLSETHCHLSLDLCGAPLFQRRYRLQTVEAPLKENLAAGVVLLSGWNGAVPLVDPMCGSGTLVIEAALLALKLPPGRDRSFAFERQSEFDAAARDRWNALRSASIASQAASLPPILASDRDPQAVAATRANVKAAGLEAFIQVEQRDVRDPDAIPEGYTLLTNPPYGQRLGGTHESVLSLYRLLGEALRRRRRGDAWIFTAAPGLESALRMNALRRHRLFNGPLETWLYGFSTATPSSASRRR
jgi:putative N6-adenine-specific DNA methylase